MTATLESLILHHAEFEAEKNTRAVFFKIPQDLAASLGMTEKEIANIKIRDLPKTATLEVVLRIVCRESMRAAKTMAGTYAIYRAAAQLCESGETNKDSAT